MSKENHLALFVGPSDPAREGVRSALSNRASAAEKIVQRYCEGNQGSSLQGAINTLGSLLDKIDGDATPPDELVDSPEKTALADRVQNHGLKILAAYYDMVSGSITFFNND